MEVEGFLFGYKVADFDVLNLTKFSLGACRYRKICTSWKLDDKEWAWVDESKVIVSLLMLFFGFCAQELHGKIFRRIMVAGKMPIVVLPLS